MRKFEFNAWIPELGYMLEDVAIGHGSIGFPSDDEDFANALKAKGFDPEELNLPTWLYDTGEDWYHITDSNQFKLLQSTCLKDINLKTVFEGDLLREPAKDDWDEKNYTSYEVFWHNNDCCDSHIGFQIDRTHYYGAICGGTLWFKCRPKDISKLVVIGNVYQNPELLKK